MTLCKACQTEKPSEAFYTRKEGTLRYPCKECIKLQYQSEKDSVSLKRKEQYAANKEAVLAYKKRYYSKNRERIIKQKNRYINDRMSRDVPYKLLRKLRTRILMAVRSGSKSGSAIDCLGCSIQEFKTYIEALWKPGMTWENHTIHGWHLDHIIPLSTFDLTEPVQFGKACHYTNFQPLWAEENWRKHAKVS